MQNQVPHHCFGSFQAFHLGDMTVPFQDTVGS